LASTPGRATLYHNGARPPPRADGQHGNTHEMTMIKTAADGETTISLLELLEIGYNARLDRATNAAEDASNALGRIADAFETFNALFASVIGVGKTTCYGGNDGADFGPPVNFIRSGRGRSVFACDTDNSDDGEG
jgi:hypothetical protein